MRISFLSLTIKSCRNVNQSCWLRMSSIFYLKQYLKIIYLWWWNSFCCVSNNCGVESSWSNNYMKLSQAVGFGLLTRIKGAWIIKFPSFRSYKITQIYHHFHWRFHDFINFPRYLLTFHFFFQCWRRKIFPFQIWKRSPIIMTHISAHCLRNSKRWRRKSWGKMKIFGRSHWLSLEIGLRSIRISKSAGLVRDSWTDH